MDIIPFILHWRLMHKNTGRASSFSCMRSFQFYYLKQLPVDRTVITCHDVLAIRGALGYEDAGVSASKTGKILQNWILNNLTDARKLAAVSAPLTSNCARLTINIRRSIQRTGAWCTMHLMPISGLYQKKKRAAF